MELKEWAKLQEILLKTQLKIIRQFLKEEDGPKFKPRGRGRSQMNVVYDILLAAQKPLHIAEIISRAKTDFDLNLDRESIVSAITKKVKTGRMFKRVEANTFTILNAKEENDP
jgi:hypothetical protein